MYRAFNLTELADFRELEKIDENEAKEDYDFHRQQVTENLSMSKILREATILQKDGDQIKIDADYVQQNIFPDYKNMMYLFHIHIGILSWFKNLHII